MQITTPNPSPFPTVVLIGLGNIGSQIIDALGRLEPIKRVILVDPDFYSTSNLASQRIRRRDVNKAKAAVQAARLTEINPSLEVFSIIDVIANVPRGMLRGAIVLTALHSIESRRDACEAAWRVSATVIDGGVAPELGLGRVTVYVPGQDRPCLECELDEIDYQNMPAKHLCGAGDDDEIPTHGTPSLGSLVASLMIIEAEKQLAGQTDGSLAGRQLVVDVTHHHQLVTKLQFNERCRFDHACRDIHSLPGVTERTALGDAFEAVRAVLETTDDVSLGVDGHEFARALHCPGCGAGKELLALPERMTPKTRGCNACSGRPMHALGFKKLARLNARQMPSRALRRSLRALGVRAGDVLVASDERKEGYFELSL